MYGSVGIIWYVCCLSWLVCLFVYKFKTVGNVVGLFYIIKELGKVHKSKRYTESLQVLRDV